METLLMLTYASLCWIIFKVFKIKVNQWSLTTAILGGVILLGLIFMSMAFYHPASKSARSYFITTPIVSNVRGLVTDVPAKANVPLKKGDVLFTIDKTPFQAKYDQVKSDLEFAKLRLKESKDLKKLAGGSKFDVEKYQKDVKTLSAELEDAKFKLDSCVVKAPTNGFITHVRVKKGFMTVPIPLLPAMTFVNTDSMMYVAGFEQQPMQNIHVGEKGEIIFPGIPGKTFRIEVIDIFPALAEGELTPTRTMLSFSRKLPPGQIPVRFKILDDMSSYYLPMGSEGVVALYNEDHLHEISIIRKVLLRMESWRYFLKFH